MKHNELIGKNKTEILSIMGDEFNVYHSDIWSYNIAKRWYFAKTLYLYFNDEGMVYKINIKTKYF